MSNKCAGYSLAEVLVAVSILAVALLGTAAALHYGMQAVLHGSLMTEASTNARTLLEVMLAENRAFSSASLPTSSSGLNDTPGTTRALNAAPFNLADYHLASGSRYLRHIEVQDYAQPSDSAAAHAWKDDVRQISVSIFWTESGHDRSLTLRSFSRRPR